MFGCRGALHNRGTSFKEGIYNSYTTSGKEKPQSATLLHKRQVAVLQKKPKPPDAHATLPVPVLSLSSTGDANKKGKDQIKDSDKQKMATKTWC